LAGTFPNNVIGFYTGGAIPKDLVDVP